MTLLYRGIWQDDRENLLPHALLEFHSWLDSKHIEVRLPDEGVVESDYEYGRAEIAVRRALSHSVDAVQFELAEERPGSGERWTTRLTALVRACADATGTDGHERGAEQWLWVDLERVADDTSVRPHLAAPRLVRALLDNGSDPRVDQVRLFTDAHKIPAKPLAGLIRNTERTLPLIVFSENPQRGFTATMRTASGVAQRFAGAAQVMILPAPQSEEFTEVIGEELSVWNGAARVYLPNAGPTGLRPDRHRYVTAVRLGGEVDRATRALASALSATVTARRPPRCYEEVRRELRLGRSRSDAERLEAAETEITRLRDERDGLKSELERMEDDLFDTQADLDEAVTQGLRAQNSLQVMLVGHKDDVAAQGTADLACEPEDMSEAVALARERLGAVVVPDGIERDLEDLDTHVNSVSWGRLTWNGLRALHVYAEDGFDGDFRLWCERSGHHWAWPASQKKLAMRESESVQSNARLAAQRCLPVDPRVDPEGRIYMWSHLKIAEGGGPLAPRVYFHDDTHGATGKVHVGFVGPHRYMENTKTN